MNYHYVTIKIMFYHSTEWPRIREQQAILEICEVPEIRNFW